MDKVGVSVLLIVFVCFSIGNANGNDDEEQRKKQCLCLWEWQRLRNAYSIYLALFPSSIGHCWWNMVKALVNHTYAHFFPPNIDFRRGEEGKDNGAGEKVREALGRSLGTSKHNMEDAANIAVETMQKAKEKVKNSFSENRVAKCQNEL